MTRPTREATLRRLEEAAMACYRKERPYMKHWKDPMNRGPYATLLHACAAYARAKKRRAK